MTVVKCINCDTDVTNVAKFTDSDLVMCTKCWDRTPTGKEDDYRRILEQDNWVQSYPRITGGRAAFYSNAIYALANQASPILFDKIEQQLNSGRGAQKATLEGVSGISGRAYGDMVDPGVGAAVIGLHDASGSGYVYVVFRGSVGAKKKSKNTGAGRDQADTSRNMDWRVNFDNKMVTARWAPGVRVHRGFHEVYESYYERVHAEMTRMAARVRMKMLGNGVGNPDPQVVITGHSQGAAHALMCAHHLSYVQPNLNMVCYPFSSPRVGDLAFARDFNNRISFHESYLPADKGNFPRCIVAVQKDDAVWKGQKTAFGGHIGRRDRKASDGAGILPKAIYSQWRSRKKTSDQTQIYYHVKFFFEAAKIGFHHPGLMQRSIVG